MAEIDGIVHIACVCNPSTDVYASKPWFDEFIYNMICWLQTNLIYKVKVHAHCIASATIYLEIIYKTYYLTVVNITKEKPMTE